jgi:hypothetical protein
MKITATPALARLERVLQHDARLLHAERRGRLVEDQDARTEVDRARDRDRLALAADSVPTCWSGSRMSMPMSRSSLRTIRFAVARRTTASGPMPFRGSAPRKKFRQIDISGTIARSW